MKSAFIVFISILSLSAFADTRVKWSASEALRDALNVKVELVDQKVETQYSDSTDLDLKFKTLTYKVSFNVDAKDLETFEVKGFRTNEDHVEIINNNAQELAAAINSYSYYLDYTVEQAVRWSQHFCNPIDGKNCLISKSFKLNYYNELEHNPWFDLITSDERIKMVDYKIVIPRTKIK